MKARSKALLQEGVARMAALQARLYAQDRWGLLLIFQAMDAAGKDGAIEHVMSGVNPQGCQVHAFKAPSLEELDHDFLWRTRTRAPRAGPHRHLQPVVLRGSADRPGPPGDPARAARPAPADDEADLEGTARGHRRARALPVPQRLRHPQVLPARLQGRAEAPLPGPDRTAREELEVRDGRRQGAPALEGVHGRPTRTPSSGPRHPRRRGSSSRPTTSGSPAW